jgi:sn-glycerol 3-phosphate transport system ATP-binding protein
MGRAIVRDPQLFLFDEPLSNLDAALRAHMRLQIKKLQRELGVTSVYVTHDQVEAMTLADRIVVLNQGEIEQVGTPSEVYHKPASRFVASFMGSPAMNFLSARLENGQLIVAGQSITVPEYSGLQQDVVLGIRPEHADTQASETSLKLNMKMSVIEPLGPNQLVHGKVEGQPFIAVTPEISFELNAVLDMYIAHENLHLFDADGKRIIPKLQ